MRTKLITIASLLVLASMILSACGPQAATGTPQVIEKTVIVAGTPQTVVVTAEPTQAQAVSFKSKDPTTFVVQTFGDPDTLYPALDYETAGSEIIQNTYDTLVWYKKDNVHELVPWLATEVPSASNGGISADGLTYTFKLRTGVKFHNGDDMKASDVAFTVVSGLLAGGTSSPQWLMYEPLLGSEANGIQDVSSMLDKDGSKGLADSRESMVKEDPAALKQVCEKVQATVTADDAANTVVFHLAQPWGPFLVTLAGSWAAIMDAKWVGANGGWDGSCDTWQNFYAPTADEVNKTKLGTTENGTGPYTVDHWTPQEELVMKANDSYWMTTPPWEGGPSGAPKLKTVIIKNVTEFSTRFAALQAGDADMAVVGSQADWPQMDTITGENCDYKTQQCAPSSTPDQALRKWTGYTVATHTDAFLNFNMSTTGGNNFIGSGKLDGNGVPPDFFSDINIRKAFAYCFDWDTFIKDVMQGEGEQTLTVMLPGEPGWSADTPHYSYDPQKCTDAFKASTWKAADGKSLWDTGFRLTIAYNTGNTQRQTIAQIFQNDIAAVNDKFVIEVTGLPWPAFLAAQRAKKLALFVSGWQEDIPDPHNWLVPYASAGGTYSGRQSLPKELTDKYQPIINAGVKETDPAKRAEIYKPFNQMYYDDVPTILLAIAHGRHYEQRWVKGWYFNPLYGDQWYYALSKD